MIKLAFPGFRNQFARTDQRHAFRTLSGAIRMRVEVVLLCSLLCDVHTCHQCEQQGTGTDAIQAQIQFVDQCYRSPTNPKQFKSLNSRLLALLRLLD